LRALCATAALETPLTAAEFIRKSEAPPAAQSRQIESADILHIAEELADMGERYRREVKSYLKHLMMHLLKWQFQPDRRDGSWAISIDDSRDELGSIVEQSPSLRLFSVEAVTGLHPAARRKASLETGLPQTAFPTECPYRFDQVMDYEFLPSDEPERSAD
jgi:Domain of unknown function DUF29